MHKRETRYELLRILAMVLIIMHHICVHSIYPQLNDASSIGLFNNTCFREPVFYPRLVIIEMLATAGKVADEIFILITGFFMVERGKSASLDKKIMNLIGQALFAAVVLVISSMLYNRFVPNENNQLFSIQDFNTSWWFLGYYILVVLVGQVFLNDFLRKRTREEYRLIILAFLAMTSLSWLGSMLTDYANGLRVAVCGLFLYALGGYIKQYNPFKKIGLLPMIMIIIMANLVLFFSKYNTTMNYITNYHMAGNEGDFLPITIYYEDYNVVPLIIGITLFELIRRINIPNSRIINSIAKATFMMYLIHDNGFVHILWQQKDWVTMLNDSLKGFFIQICVQVIVIMAIGVALYTFYQFIIRPIWLRYLGTDHGE